MLEQFTGDVVPAPTGEMVPLYQVESIMDTPYGPTYDRMYVDRKGTIYYGTRKGKQFRSTDGITWRPYNHSLHLS